MPRDANGNYILPTGNPVATDTLIESTWANTTMQDLAAEMTDSLSRSGKGGFTGPVPIVDKSGVIPGLSFVDEPTSGLKREGAGDVRLQVQGSDRMRWRAGAAQIPEVQIDGVWYAISVAGAGFSGMVGVAGETVIPMYNATIPPAGWSLFTVDANVRNLTIGGTGATTGGNDDPTNMSDSVNISISGNTGNAGSHQHFYQFESNTPSQGDENVAAGSGASAARQNHSHNSGAQQTQQAGNHNHSISGSDSDNVSFQPRHAFVILARLET